MRILKRPGRANWYVKVTDSRIENKDQSVIKATGEKNKTAAWKKGLQIEAEIMASLSRNVQPKAGAIESLDTAYLLKVDLERLTGQRPAKGHVKALELYWRHLGSFFTDYRDVSPDRVLEYVRFRRGPDDLRPRVRNQSIAKELQALHRVLTKLRDERGFAIRCFPKVPKLPADPPNEKQAGRRVAKEEIFQLFDEISSNARLYYQAFFIISTGLRYEESMKAETSMARDPEEKVPNGIAKILDLPGWACKWGRPRRVALTHEAWAAMQNLGPRPYRMDKVLREACKRVRLPTISARSLRHAVYRGGAECGNAFAVKLHQGHKELDSSAHYIHGWDSLTASVAAAHHAFYSLDAVWAKRARYLGVGGTKGGTILKLVVEKTA